jgi:hypothetical protein
MAAPGTPTGDPRRLAADGRLRRLKRGLVAASLGAWMVLWALVAGSVSAQQAANPPATESTTRIIESDRFFSTGSTSLGSANGSAPMLRSGGS